MKKVDQDTRDAFADSKSKRICRNTSIAYVPEAQEVTLEIFGNEIAKRSLRTGKISINFCGYPTQTTIRRLNASIQGLRISVKKEKLIVFYREHLQMNVPTFGWYTLTSTKEI